MVRCLDNYAVSQMRLLLLRSWLHLKHYLGIGMTGLRKTTKYLSEVSRSVGQFDSYCSSTVDLHVKVKVYRFKGNIEPTSVTGATRLENSTANDRVCYMTLVSSRPLSPFYRLISFAYSIQRHSTAFVPPPPLL